MVKALFQADIMLQPKTSVFIVLLIVAAAFAQEDCPNSDSACPDNCDRATKCGRFLNSECRVNPCHGLCTPNFFWRGRNVTDRCEVNRCVDKVCPVGRQCIEETVPASCPEGRPLCRQYIRSRCIIPPPLTNCSQITCGPGMFCRERKRHEEVVCVRAKTCEQLTCDEGFTCSITERGPECTEIEVQLITTTSSMMPSVTTPYPNFCDFCERLGEICQVVNGTYQCTVPTQCVPARINYCLNVLGQLCAERDGQAECVFAESCNDIDCPHGTICEEIPLASLARCNRLTMAETCDQLDCEPIGQVCEQRADSAVCVPGCTQEQTEICEQVGGRCEIDDDGIPECVIPSNCDEITCDPGFTCIVIEAFTNDTQDIATCFEEPKQTCEEVVCPEGQLCTQWSLPSRNLSLAGCLDQDIATSFPSFDEIQCATSHHQLCEPSEVCTNLFEQGQFLTFVCSNYTTDCIDDSACSSDTVCTDLPENFTSLFEFTSICLPTDDSVFEIGDSCVSGSKQCPGGLVCQDISFSDTVIGTTCGISNPNVLGPSCDELECQALFECLETIVPDGDGVAQCVDEETVSNTLSLLGVS